MQKENTGKKLSRQQKNVLNFIREYTRKNRTAPTQKEIARHFDLNISTISRHVQALRALNEIERIPGARGLLLPEQSPGSFCGACSRVVKISINTYEEPRQENGVVMLDDKMMQLCPAEQFTAYSISDDSMIDIGIHYGDTVLAVPVTCKPPRSGDLVVIATPEKTFTIRSFYPSDHFFELLPAHPGAVARRCLYRSGIILGTVVQLIRNF